MENQEKTWAVAPEGEVGLTSAFAATMDRVVAIRPSETRFPSRGNGLPCPGQPLTGLVRVRSYPPDYGGALVAGSRPRKVQTRSYPRLEAILSRGTSRAASESGLLKSGAAGTALAARS